MELRKSGLVCLCAIACASIAVAQSKDLGLQDLIPGGKNYSRFVPKSVPQLQWCGDSYLYTKGDSVIMGDAVRQGKNSLKCVTTLQTMNKALEDAGLKTIGNMPRISVLDQEEEEILSFRAHNVLVHYNYKENKVERSYNMDKGGANYEYCPATGYFAFTEGNNVRVLSPENKVSVVTDEKGEGIVCGQSVHQNEFGIHKGLFWSPDGSQLAFYRMDESMVTPYPLVDITARCATVNPRRYPMAGMKSHHVTVGIYNVESGKTTWLKTGTPKEKFLTNVAWSPDSKYVYIAELNREQNEMHLVRYSAETGSKDADLFTEKNEHYVEPQQPVLFLPENPDQFIWQSQRDGFNHLYLYNTDGTLVRQLTEGRWIVSDVLGFDEKGDNLFISATKPISADLPESNNPLSVKTWKLNIKKGTLLCMSPSEQKVGVHNTMLSHDGKYLIDNYSSWNVPRNIDIIETKKGKTLKNILTAKNPYEGYVMPEVERGTIKAADGTTDLNYFIVKPGNMVPGKKYPTIVYVYGGPHAQLVTGNWMGGVSGWDIYMANRGYVVFTVDSRGSANRGFDFESVIHRNLGVNEMADQVKGVEFLKTKSYVDADRIGVHGWSYGGFMTTNLMLTYPDIFKVGVAGGPVIDWSKYEIMYGERYMDRPQENPEGYKNANLKLKAGNLKGHLLMIHGDIDPVVVWQHSLGFLKACVEANTYPDYFVYPGHEHNVIGKDRPHLHEKITRYFDDYLK